MARDVQFNLFGDIIETDDQSKKHKKEVKYAQSLGQDGKKALADSPTGLFREALEEWDSRTRIGDGRAPGGGYDGRTNVIGDEAQRGNGDSTSSVNSTDSREGQATDIHSAILDSPTSVNLYGKSVQITHYDSQAIIDQYAEKYAGIDPTGKTRGFALTSRRSQGIKLWEEMSFDEKKQEVLEYIKNDIKVSMEESQGNPVNYLLDRALDPLDPLQEVYKQIFQNAGAIVDNNNIKLPDYLNNLLNEETEITIPSLPRAPDTLRNGRTDDRGNYHITKEDPIGKGGKADKFLANLEAIRIIKSIEKEKRNATTEEQSKLVKYTGWGGLSEVFKDRQIGIWAERHRELKEILTDQEYRSASRSTLNAHYTDPAVARAMWDGLCRMGYFGGPTMEPACGVGHFFGTRPQHIPVEMHGIELDSMSGRIARQLYQSADIRINAYENIRMQESYYNLFVSNVPFGDVKPYEEKEVQTPGIDNRYAIHDYYFLKSLYGTRPGGLIAFITSRYTMDKMDTEVREKIAQSADLIAAIRLPNTAFRDIANTEVVADIVFLQKRNAKQPLSELTRRFIETGEIELKDEAGASKNASINGYFIDHPEMVLGNQELTGSMYSGSDYTVRLDSDLLTGRLNQAVLSLPENIMNMLIDERTKELDTPLIPSPENNLDHNNLPPGSFIIGTDSKLYQKDIETGRVLQSHLYERDQENKEDIIRIIRMAEIRDTFKNAIHSYYRGEEAQDKLKTLNQQYDQFVGEYGYINAKSNLKLFIDDPDVSLLQSLENWDPKAKKAVKAEIFKGISFHRSETVTSVDNPVDAMALSLSRYGSINMAYMESLTGEEGDRLIQSLMANEYIYADPSEFISNEKTVFIVADQYLSGNIRNKLKEARVAAEKNPGMFSRNVSSLESVMPKDIQAQDISLRINSPIIGEEHLRKFIDEQFEAYNTRILHVKMTGKWEINTYIPFNLNHESYGTNRMSAVDILNNLMNGRPIKVFDYSRDEDTPPVLNQEATSAAELKAETIQNAFAQWLWKDKDRTDDIVRRYNEVYNSHIERKYTHPDRMNQPDAEVHIHGCNFPFPLRPHQSDAVWRVIQEKNTMLAHTVGSGKTLEIACSAMELRRLGIRSKPMIVCPDHMIGQWGAEFRQAYPAAKLLIADDMNWDKSNRRTFINKIATGDWDAVIIRAESFKMIPMSDEYQQRFYEKKIAEYRDILNSIDTMNRRNRSVKDLEKSILKYEDKIKELSDMRKDEGVLPFDQLGIDHLFIDEADIYKNLEYYTQLQNVRGLGTPLGSERALDMLMKIRFVQEKDGGITFATGTPISNTLVEAYTMQRFLQPEVMKANGLEAFDEWARQYAESVTQMELNNTGTGYKPVTRFSKIVNVPELVTSLRLTWDIQTAYNLEQNGILVPGLNLPIMKIINESSPSTPLLKSYLKYLEQRERALKGKPEKGNDNVLSIMTDGRKAAVDLRFINPHLPDDPDSKLNLGVRIIHDVYTRYQAESYTCAVFFDKSRSYDPLDSQKTLFDGVSDMKTKLIGLGVNEDEIGDVRDCKTFGDRQRLFQRVNEGKIRVIFGSTDTMGAGTNFQTFLKAIVHIDAPWRPRDIEQQNGRGYRPGNMTGELEVYNLVTKGSLDTGLWNILETKANSIRQVMDGSDKDTRQIEESYYGSVKELSIDNPLMKESVELDHQLRKLKSQERAFNNEQAHAHRMLSTLPAAIKDHEKNIESIRRDIETRYQEQKGDHFVIILDGKEYSDRKIAGTVLLNNVRKACLQAMQSNRKIEYDVGSYAGFPLSLESTAANANGIGRINIMGEKHRYSIDIRDESNPVGICQSLHMQVYKGIDRHLEESLRILGQKTSSLTEYEKVVNSQFPKRKELGERDTRYNQVMELLRKEAENKGPDIANPYEIKWVNIGSMLPEEIHIAVKSYLDNLDQSISLITDKEDKLTIQDIQNDKIEKNSMKMDNWGVYEIKDHKGDIGDASWCFRASIYQDGRKIADVENDGTGGCHFYRFESPEKDIEMQRWIEYCWAPSIPREILGKEAPEILKMDDWVSAEIKRLYLPQYIRQMENEWTVEDIQQNIYERHSIKLIPAVVAIINKGIADGSLNVEHIQNEIHSIIENSKSGKFVWKDNPHRDYHSAYLKEPDRIMKGDILVRKKEDGPSSAYFEAYNVLDNNSVKYLGSEKELPSMKARIEKYALSASINNKIMESFNKSAGYLSIGVKENDISV